MDKNTAMIIHLLCQKLDGYGYAWEGISYSAIHEDDASTRRLIKGQIKTLELTLNCLKRIDAAFNPIDPIALKHILEEK